MGKSHEEWQVKQADTALRLYQYFLSQDLKASATGTLGEWETLEDRLREALRLRQWP